MFRSQFYGAKWNHKTSSFMAWTKATFSHGSSPFVYQFEHLCVLLYVFLFLGLLPHCSSICHNLWSRPPTWVRWTGTYHGTAQFSIHLWTSLGVHLLRWGSLSPLGTSTCFSNAFLLFICVFPNYSKAVKLMIFCWHLVRLFLVRSMRHAWPLTIWMFI